LPDGIGRLWGRGFSRKGDRGWNGKRGDGKGEEEAAMGMGWWSLGRVFREFPEGFRGVFGEFFRGSWGVFTGGPI